MISETLICSEEETFKKIYTSIAQDFKVKGLSRLAIYGGGKFCQRFLATIKDLTSIIKLSLIIDDQTKDNALHGIPLVNSKDFKLDQADAIFLATDSIEKKLKNRVEELYGNKIIIYSLSELMKLNNIVNRDLMNSEFDTRSIWQKAYDHWQAGHQCSSFKDSLVLAVIWNSSAHYQERIIENSFVSKLILNLPCGKVLDIGSSALEIPRTLNDKNFSVTCLDPCVDNQVENGIEIVRGDIRHTIWSNETFDYVTCISTIEHIGVSGRYGITKEDPQGDLKAIKEIYRILKPNGKLFLTIPFGSEPILPINKVYSHYQILEMTKDFDIISSEFYKPDGKGEALKCSAEEASLNDWRRDGYYALGCYQLIKK